MSVNLMPKLFRYSIVYNGVTTVLTTDPKGWQEQSIGFTRSEDYGLNTEYTVPLSFTKQGYSMIKSIFDSGGMFSKAYIKIEKRKDDWTYEQFYLYRLDFKTYKDNGYCIDIDGVEEGLMSLFSANVDTEYEIEFPTRKKYLKYNGVLTRKSNILNVNYGKTKQTGSDDKKYYLFGKRAVRTYTDSLNFDEQNGEPFSHVMFQCLTETTISIRIVSEDMKVFVPYVIGGTNPTGGKLMLVSHSSDWSSFITLWQSGESTDKSWNFWGSLTEHFKDIDTTITVNTNLSQPYIELIYVKNDDHGGTPEIQSQNAAYIDIFVNTMPEYSGIELEVFSHEWLIGELLKKIYPDAILNYTVTHQNVFPYLTCTQSVYNAGNYSRLSKIKTSLKDVLKSIDVLCCIGIDISGNTFSVSDRSSFYNKTLGKRVKANNITLQFDDKNCYGKINAGGKTSDTYETVCYPFNCIRNYSVQNSDLENEYNLEHPFMIDQFQIEDYILKSVREENTTKTNSETKFIVFACVPVSEDQSASKNNDCGIYNYSSSDEITLVTQTNQSYDPKFYYNVPSLISGDYLNVSDISIFKIDKQSDGTFIIRLSLILNMDYLLNRDNVSFNYSGLFPEGATEIQEVIHWEHISGDTCWYDVSAKVKITDSVFFPVFKINFSGTVSNFKVTGMNFSITGELSLVMAETITEYTGDVATAYNIPFTAKRIINKHLPYISASNWRNGTNKIKFITSEKISPISSKLSYEESSIVENADFDTVEPLFKPVIITFDTQENYDTIENSDESKYNYIEVEDEKSGKVYKGWKNKTTYSVGKNQTQSWELQAYDI